ncbi:acetyl-coenzyme A carboxylase carboxyl transferase subunit alpha, chloroplastic-like [Actinidia eriantha]|uniref:acetyl-coenzyme A carboxylase carboxyl transferase subunit alpha, chloroplastic-like n=1 Tax=Actinidia eriantha TaxID=165200 RepID=UPI002583E051|nr:acetyl-coenzyme A carboxylase carboxyl transferase subunit alpha, chloroplastic-like [Actinidia eriantha]XP_057512234.1 acetyl-coenzyme A carboxylase carboxyl transferase subunit alpha, chloroplastic-like [Actinidia eriantha]XP_057512243.1 acetyl-coenzyme A carboxylase carboxyl transferase subunit alpha, chloroplastic-like [Actinidia eriantha]
MATLSHSSVTLTGNLVSGTPAWNLRRRSSINGVIGLPVWRARFGATRRAFTVSAKVRKGKKREYPWPKDADPNVEGGLLRHLSPFKPLKEKPKPVILEFEKHLVDRQKTIVEVKKLSNETGMDFSDQIIELENKYQQALKDTYTNLTPIQRVYIARHPNRPTFLDHVFNITEKFVELHGDRCGYDDPAIVAGLGSINGRSYMFIGHQKGRNTKENIQRNFGMPTPHGYRKALRMMYYADHHGFPIISFIDTPGAFADIRSEEIGQGEAIANNLRTMFGLRVPVITIVIGEGGSGGALAIGCANKMLMLENAVFYVASPEACAAILWKSAKAAPKAAEALKITAGELCKMRIADGVIPEPLGGAHADPYWTSQQIKTAIVDAMAELVKMDTQDLVKHRMLKYRKIGAFREGIPIDPIKKRRMRKREKTYKDGELGKLKQQILEGKELSTQLPELGPNEMTYKLKREEDKYSIAAKAKGGVEKLKQLILKAKESSIELPLLHLNKIIDKLKEEVDFEFSRAVKAMGLKGKLAMLQGEFAKARNSKDQPMNLDLKDKIEKLKDEFDRVLSAAPNYASLKYKLDMLNELTEVKNLYGNNKEADTLKQEINQKLEVVLDQPDVKKKIEALKKEIEDSGTSTFADLDQRMKEKILQVKQDIELKSAIALISMGLQLEPPFLSDLNVKIEEFNEEINEGIEEVIYKSDLKYKIEQLKLEVAKARMNPDTESKIKILVLEQQIKQGLAKAMSSSELKKKFVKLKAEISEGISAGLNRPLFEGFMREGNSKHDDDSIIEVNLEATRSLA